MKKLLIAITAMLTLAATAMAEVKVAEAFSSHMVLQREKPVSVWGVADAGEKVKVSFGKQTLSTIADKAGLWRVTLKAMPANSRPQVMVISGRKNKIRLTDVLVGEVWLASGQSNMEYSMNNHPRYRKPQKGDADYQLKAWREANNPNIRVLYVRPDLNSDVLPTDGWQRVDSTSLKPVSAAAYFFARMLQDSLQVPVGFISSSWGGTRIEEWIPDGKTPGRRPMYEHLIRPLTGYALRGAMPCVVSCGIRARQTSWIWARQTYIQRNKSIWSMCGADYGMMPTCRSTTCRFPLTSIPYAGRISYRRHG